MAVNMVRAGSEGLPKDALERVATFVELQEELKGKTVGALAYPLFINSVGTIIVTILLVYFVPKFDPLFATMRQRGSLPAATELLLAISRATQGYWWIVLAVMADLVVFAFQYLKTEAGKRRFDLLKIKTPLLGTVFLI